MKRALVIVLLCSILPISAIAKPIVDVAIHLAEQPDVSLEEFKALIDEVFQTHVEYHHSFSPKDVPTGHEDPLYWAVTFATTSEDSITQWTCSRIGRKSDLLLRETTNAQDPYSLDSRNPKKTLQGVWPQATEAFVDDADARFDCTVMLAPELIDVSAALNSLETVFSDFQIIKKGSDFGGQEIFYNEIIATEGESHSDYRLNNAFIASMDRLPPATLRISSWLLRPAN